MNKYLIILVISIAFFVQTNAQDNMGVGTLTPNPKALLELQSTNKGLLIPRLTTAQRIAITGLGFGEKALLVFDTDINKFYYWDATQWIAFPLDNDISNELQDLTLQNDSIVINGGTGVDLSSFLDNTDDQNLSFSNDTLYIENGNFILITDNVDDADNDISNELQDLTLQNDSIVINGGTGVDLSSFLDNTDDQNLSFSNDTLYIENGNFILITDNVDDADNDISNELQDLTLQNDSIVINGGTGVDLSSFLDNTDDQNLTGATLNALNVLAIDIENGTSTTVDLSSLDDNGTDDQNLTGATLNASNVLAIDIENGTSTSVDLSSLDDNGTDDQNLTSATLNGSNVLTINIENGSSTSVNLNSLAGGSATVDHDWHEFGTSNIPNNINDNLYTDGKVSIGLNNNNNFNLNVERNIMLTTNNSNQVSSYFKGILAGINDTISGGSYYNLIIGDNNKKAGITDGMYILGNGNYLGGISDNKYVFGNDNYVRTNGSQMSFTVGDNNYDSSNGSNIVLGRNNNLGSNGGNDYVIGRDNLSDGNGGNITIIGRNDTATGSGSYLIGNDLKATSSRSFSLGAKCWANRTSFYIGDASYGASVLTGGSSYAMNMRFRGGYRFFTNNTLTSGVTLASGGGAWASVSDRNKKENFKDLDKQDVLDRLVNFEIYDWNYKSQEDSIRHIGPFAQDFYKAYQLGTSNKSIVTSDISGVNMVAIQALNEKNENLQKEVLLLKEKNDANDEKLIEMDQKIQKLLLLMEGR